MIIVLTYDQQSNKNIMKAQYTRSQAQIIQFLKSLDGAISAQDLYRELKCREQPLGLATVYRALRALKVQGAVKSQTLTSGEALYSLIAHDQYHLNCVNCGQSFPVNECLFYDLEERLEQTYDFRVYYHTLEFFGRCLRCQSTAESGMEHCSQSYRIEELKEKGCPNCTND
jgi:Fur family ferric uptake transcriptional regulator